MISSVGRVIYATMKWIGDEIDKDLLALSIIDRGCLAFLRGRKLFLREREATRFTFCEVTRWRVESSGIATKHLLAIPR